MEFLDPKKHKTHMIRLFVGYFLIATALVLTTVILLYQAYGFGIKNGQVIQNGLIFMSSTPDAASIYVNGALRSERTDVRLLMPAGQSTFELKREGYNTWKRAVNVEGGTVARFDYPLLIPSKLTPVAVKKYAVKPTMATQSPDRRWILVQAAAAFNTFEVFDLTKADKEPVTLTLPETVSTLSGVHSWKPIEWSTDNSHVLLQHAAFTKDGKAATEYILVDRESPEKSVNITAVLAVNPTELHFQDKKFDKFFVYTGGDKKLSTASLAQPKLQPFLNDVLDFKVYGSDVALYATASGAPEGKVLIKLQEGQNSYTIRQVAAEGPYMLEIAKYDGNWFAVAGASSEGRTYIYKNPQEALRTNPTFALVPIQVFKGIKPQYVSFSENTRFIVAQNGLQFATYDAEAQRSYAYDLKDPIDSPQTYVDWADGNHLTYVSGNKQILFDYDNTNHQTLGTSDPLFKSALDRDAKNFYSLATQTAKDGEGKDITQYVLSATPLRTTADR